MDTRFYIDYEWWEQTGRDIRLHIQQLCEEFSGIEMGESRPEEIVDWIDPETGEVIRVDRMMYMFLTQCSRHPEYITERTTLIEAVFRALLAAANRPMTPRELGARTGRSPEMILRTLAGQQVYKGIRPYIGE